VLDDKLRRLRVVVELRTKKNDALRHHPPASPMRTVGHVAYRNFVDLGMSPLRDAAAHCGSTFAALTLPMLRRPCWRSTHP
jgi:hypothetical protein